jgi:hypothetical protein
MTAEIPKLAILNMKNFAGPSGISVGRLLLKTVSGFTAITSIFI